MNEESRAALLNSQVACAIIEAQGMTAANKQEEYEGKCPMYDCREFSLIIERYGLGYNKVISMLQGR